MTSAKRKKPSKRQARLEDIHYNPNNPRRITSAKLEKLKQSILHFPEMMKVRPLVVDDTLMVLGGNMRLRALHELRGDPEAVSNHFTDDPDGAKRFKRMYLDKTWIEVRDWDPEKDGRFLLTDNISYGEWDYDELMDIANFEEFSTELGMDIPAWVFQPVVDPSLDASQVTPEEIARKAEEMRKTGGEGRIVIQTICPHCGGEFEIDRQ